MENIPHRLDGFWMESPHIYLWDENYGYPHDLGNLQLTTGSEQLGDITMTLDCEQCRMSWLAFKISLEHVGIAASGKSSTNGYWDWKLIWRFRLSQRYVRIPKGKSWCSLKSQLPNTLVGTWMERSSTKWLPCVPTRYFPIVNDISIWDIYIYKLVYVTLKPNSDAFFSHSW